VAQTMVSGPVKIYYLMISVHVAIIGPR